MKKQLIFRAATAGLEKYRTGSYGQIGVYRVNAEGGKVNLKDRY